ncbi:MAG: histone deacetylase [Deltaproteobacteria bacterium]|nr:histone deacetylase [Deltaproteobacteria bacterium]MBI2347705.1 histone deacetylase [Deltaproteobacteria bacterium]MBI2539210.1 histone deacetylase [Deltaproteobacteria bacterium]MBI2992117.1 histone deacetylase [Deltaproteobacteria bacterium]MBI3061977.1 histone deacetylase [Deltaproteobacteria bacterium]
MPVVFVYSEGYYADIGAHVFPVEKYRLVYQQLRKRGVIGGRLIEPEPGSPGDLLLVHDRDYVEDLVHARLTERTFSSELPISKEIIRAFLLATGGAIRASEEALREGCAVNLSGGFHHAFPDHAEGFCYINDMAVAVRRVQSQRKGIRIAVVDCDLHQGNGTAFIFKDDESVYTFSIHQRDLYPLKQDSSWDIHLKNGVGDEEYLAHLEKAIPAIMEKFKPDFVLYQAGADPYEGDQLGDLKLTIEGLKERDALVFGECKKRGVPVAALLGGGYAVHTNDTVTIHVNTCLAAVECFG